MITVLVEEDGEQVGEMRIECLALHANGTADYSIEFAADSGGGWVDLKSRVLYGFKHTKYNRLALVSEALNLLNLQDMEMTDAGHSGCVARGEREAGRSLPREADDPVDHNRPALRVDNQSNSSVTPTARRWPEKS